MLASVAPRSATARDHFPFVKFASKFR